MAYGNEVGIVVIDIVQKCVVLNMGTPDLYGSADPYQRVPRSPKRGVQGESKDIDERCRSPSNDQVGQTRNMSSRCSLSMFCSGAGMLENLSITNHSEVDNLAGYSLLFISKDIFVC